jgi:hypothetical protein
LVATGRMKDNVNSMNSDFLDCWCDPPIANKAAAVNAPIPARLHAERAWRRVTEQQRSVIGRVGCGSKSTPFLTTDFADSADTDRMVEARVLSVLSELSVV